jgi:hypothetical protein
MTGWGNTVGALSCRGARLAAPMSLATICAFATPAFAGTSDMNAADTAWMMVATALVLMMTVPGLALFYSGMVRKASQPWPLFRFSGWRSAIRWRSSATVPGSYAGSLVSRRHDHGRRQSRGEDNPGSLVHALPDDLCDHHRGAGGGLRRRPDAVLRLSPVFHRLVHVRLRPARALGVGRRLPRLHGRAGFRRRPRGASQRRHRRPGRSQGDGPAPGLWHRQSVTVRFVARSGRHRIVVGRLVRLQRRIGSGGEFALSWRSSPPILRPVPTP